MRARALAAAAGMCAAVTLATAAEAQDRRYQEWRDPDAAADLPPHTEKLIEDLERLVRQGRRDRAASPDFLTDLENALARHRRAQDQARTSGGGFGAIGGRADRDLFDDFRDGDFTRNPEWRLVRGEFFVARDHRLFSFVAPQGGQPRNDTEAVVQLFGTLLGARQGDSGSGDRGADEPAVILLPERIDNSFEIRADLMGDSRTGGLLEMGVYQGRDARNGYRLQFTGDGVVRLVRVGRSVVELGAGPFEFPRVVNGRPGTYKMRWQRRDDGRMLVHVNGRRVLDVTDRGFRDDFDGFRLVNAEGRHGLDEIRIGSSR
jgi:hypothetical protein